MKLRRSEVAILAFGAAFLVVLAVYFRPGRTVDRDRRSAAGSRGLPAGSAEDGQPTTVLSGFDYTESIGDKPAFRIRAERTIGYGAGAGLPPNRYALEKVSLTVYPRDGSPVTIHSERAQYDDRTKAAVLSGNVRWSEARDATLGETESVEFDPKSRILRAPSGLHFTRGSFDLTAASGAYDLERRVLSLTGPIQGSGTGAGTGGLSSLAARSGEYRRDESVMELSGEVVTTSAKGDRLQCDRLLIKFSPEGNRPEWARAYGAVRGSMPAAAGGARTYGASEAALFFDAAGEVRTTSLTGAPASVDEPARRLEARSVDLDFAGGRPVAARANGDVRLRSDRGHAQSHRASASFAPSGDFQTLELDGDVRLEGEGRTGRASRVVDIPDRGVWVLTGSPATSATVEEGGSKISAARIEIDGRRKLLRSEGNARAVFVSGKEGPRQASSLLGESSEPTYGKGQRIVLDRETRVATLSGGASLWQEESALFADDITLNDAERTAVGVGNVRLVLDRPESRAGGSRAKEGPAVVTARRLLYRESESSAVFEDGVTVARGSWRATSQRGVAFFGKDRALDRVELTGSVDLADRATGRTATAERAIDHPREGRTVLHGSPARVADAEGNRVAGSTLTITSRGKNVEVTAPEGGRTETIHKTKKE